MAARSDTESVALFGGSFNPPHVGHVLAADYALAVGGFDRILVVPVFSHAFDKELESFEHRLRMCELAFARSRGTEVCAIEQELGVPSRTVRTIRALYERHPNWQLSLLIGADVVLEFHKWHAFDVIEKLAPPFVLGRRGVREGHAPVPILPEVSSSEIRHLLANLESEGARERLAAIVPRSVLEYVFTHGLNGGERRRAPGGPTVRDGE